jgi:peptide/nickel transport system permease protein
VRIKNRKLRLFLAHRGAVVGLLVLLCLTLPALSPTFFASQDPNQSYDTNGDPEGLKARGLSYARPPSFQHLMGTDTIGRDIYANVVHGARVSLRIGFIAVSISLVLGVAIGGLAGSVGGLIDTLLMRAVDVMLSFPSIVLALLIVTMLGQGIEQVMIAVGVAGVPRFARQMRAEVLSLREREFIVACEALGLGQLRTFLFHVLPNSLGPLTVLASLATASAVLEAAGLGFLGLGAPTGTPEWGTILADNRANLRDFYWVAVFPGLAIAATVLGFNLVGDGIRDAFDPTTTARGHRS